MRPLLDGPHAVIRPAVVRDEWMAAPLDRLAEMARERGGVLLGTEVEADVPVEARCRLCEVRPIEPGEPEEAYTAYLKGEGAAVGPVTLAAAQRWLSTHLTWRHGLDGIGASYAVESGSERWVL